MTSKCVFCLDRVLVYLAPVARTISLILRRTAHSPHSMTTRFGMPLWLMTCIQTGANSAVIRQLYSGKSGVDSMGYMCCCHHPMHTPVYCGVVL